MSGYKCQCGGKLKYYDGAMGYEALVCQECKFHWNATTPEAHIEQIFKYRRTHNLKEEA